MLNYLWAGMILLSIIFSLAHDISAEVSNKYNNGAVHSVKYELTNIDGMVSISLHNNLTQISLKKLLSQSPEKRQLTLVVTDSFPQKWKQIAEDQSSEFKQELQVNVVEIHQADQYLSFELPPVHWVKARAITQAAFDMAKFAVKLAIGLAGIMALWLGLMRVAEKSGLISYFVRLIYPLLHWLFPAIDKRDPVLGSISLNMAANMLGLGNAATPMGIKAMQQLQELNKKKDTASDEMCMFLAINTSSVQLLPPVTLIAVMGAGVSELIVPIILATTASTIAAISSAKLFARMRTN